MSRGQYLRWSPERLRILGELFAEGYDCTGAAARLSVILDRAVSEDAVRRAAVRAGLEPQAGRRAAPAPFGVLESSADIPRYFRSPPPQIASGLAALEREALAREAERAAEARPWKTIIFDEPDGRHVTDEEVEARVVEARAELWRKLCNSEAQAGRVSVADAEKAALMKPPSWFNKYVFIIVIHVFEVTGGAPSEPNDTSLSDIGSNTPEPIGSNTEPDEDEEGGPW